MFKTRKLKLYLNVLFIFLISSCGGMSVIEKANLYRKEMSIWFGKDEEYLLQKMNTPTTKFIEQDGDIRMTYVTDYTKTSGGGGGRAQTRVSIRTVRLHATITYILDAKTKLIKAWHCLGNLCPYQEFETQETYNGFLKEQEELEKKKLAKN